jgi:hypothetical protein
MFAGRSGGSPQEILFGYHRTHEVLTNFVDAGHLRHILWLKWLGCYMIRRVERFGAQSRRFIQFASVRR